jgi:hypothetical protein
LISSLNPVVQVLHSFSGVLGDVTSLVSAPSFSMVFYFYAAFQPTNVIFSGIDVLLGVCASLTFFDCIF